MLMESNRVLKHVSCKLVVYEKIEMILPERKADLIVDLKQRTGLEVTNVEIGSVDFLKDVAYLKVFYISREVNTADNITRIRDFNGSQN